MYTAKQIVEDVIAEKHLFPQILPDDLPDGCELRHIEKHDSYAYFRYDYAIIHVYVREGHLVAAHNTDNACIVQRFDLQAPDSIESFQDAILDVFYSWKK